MIKGVSWVDLTIVFMNMKDKNGDYVREFFND